MYDNCKLQYILRTTQAKKVMVNEGRSMSQWRWWWWKIMIDDNVNNNDSEGHDDDENYIDEDDYDENYYNL